MTAVTADVALTGEVRPAGGPVRLADTLCRRHALIFEWYWDRRPDDAPCPACDERLDALRDPAGRLARANMIDVAWLGHDDTLKVRAWTASWQVPTETGRYRAAQLLDRQWAGVQRLARTLLERRPVPVHDVRGLLADPAHDGGPHE